MSLPCFELFPLTIGACQITACATRDKTVLLYDIDRAAATCTLTGHASAVYGVQQWRSAVASCGDDKTVRLWDTRSGHCTAVLTGHRAGVMCLQMDDYRLASGSYDHRINIWDTRKVTGSIGAGAAPSAAHPAFLYSLYGHGEPVFCLQFSEHVLVSGSGDKTVKIFDFTNARHAPDDDMGSLRVLKINGISTARQFLRRSEMAP
jgi:WD40 repeat protein